MDRREDVLNLYSDADVQSILAVAIGVEQRRSDAHTLAEIRDTARELGISDDALAVAISHFHDRPAPVEQTVSTRHAPVRFAIAGATLGIVTEGVFTSMLGTGPLSWAIVAGIVTMFVSGGLATMRNGRTAREGLAAFELKNTAMWAGFFIAELSYAIGGGMLSQPAFLQNMLIEAVVSMWLISTVIGGGVAAWRSRISADPMVGPGVETTTFKRRLANRLKSWIDAVLTRSALTDPIGGIPVGP